MPPLFAGIATALWLGIMTSISPCPLATNIAAISYLGRRITNPRLVIWAGIIYTAGRSLAYLALGIVLINSLMATPVLSRFLQNNFNKILGPVLIVTGMFLLEMLRFSFNGSIVSEKLKGRAETWGLWGAGLIGFIFALSFCPVSAALFFGSLIPLGVEYESGLLLPTIYGLGTGLPVFVFALLLAFSARSLGKVFDAITRVEVWLRRTAGVVFIGAGIYFCLIYIFGLPI